MSLLETSAKAKKAIEEVSRETAEKVSRSSVKAYKAVIVTAPYQPNNSDRYYCGIRLMGDETEITVLCPPRLTDLVAGDFVWVIILFSSWKNAVVWQKYDFSTDTGGGGSGGDGTSVYINNVFSSAIYFSSDPQTQINDKLSKTGDGKDVTVTFSEGTKTTVDADFATGSTLSTLWGEVKAWFKSLKTVAFSGSYNDLENKPTIPAAQVNSDWNATSGVAEILNKPTIPAAQVNSDWDATSGVAEILNKPTIPTVPTISQTQNNSTTSVPSDNLLLQSSFARVYREYSDLGITVSANTTMNDICSAMVNNSEAYLRKYSSEGSVDLSTKFPLSTGSLHIMKYGNSRTSLEFFSAATPIRKFIGYYNTDLSPTFTGWKEIIKAATNNSPENNAIYSTTNTASTPSQCLANGFYYVSSSSTTGDDANPFYQYHTGNPDFRILATSHSANWVQQIATDFRTNYIYYRRRESGTWTNWVQWVNSESNTNNNLFSNPDFEIYYSTATQTSGFPCADWQLYSAGSGQTLSYNPVTKTLTTGTQNTSGYYGGLRQWLYKPYLYKGKTVTFSAAVSSYTYSWLIQVWRYTSLTSSATSLVATSYSQDYNKSLTFTMPSDLTENDLIVFLIQTQGVISLDYAKLEFGNCATGFIPPMRSERQWDTTEYISSPTELGLSVPCSTLDILNAIRERVYTNTLKQGGATTYHVSITTSQTTSNTPTTISDTPDPYGELTIDYGRDISVGNATIRPRIMFTSARGQNPETQTATYQDRIWFGQVTRQTVNNVANTYTNIRWKELGAYCTCKTAGSTVAKVATVPYYTLRVGNEISVYFDNENTATNPTLNINKTGAYSIFVDGSAATGASGNLAAGWHTFYFDGSHYRTGTTSGAVQWGEVNTTYPISSGSASNSAVLSEKAVYDGVVGMVNSGLSAIKYLHICRIEGTDSNSNQFALNFSFFNLTPQTTSMTVNTFLGIYYDRIFGISGYHTKSNIWHPIIDAKWTTSGSGSSLKHILEIRYINSFSAGTSSVYNLTQGATETINNWSFTIVNSVPIANFIT